MNRGTPHRNSDSSLHQTGWWRQQWMFTWKELCETLRDRRTTVTLFVMPVLLYPLVGLMLQFVAVSDASRRAPEYRIAIRTEEEAARLSSLMRAGDQLLRAQTPPTPIIGDGGAAEPTVQLLVPEQEAEFNLSETVAGGIADIGVRVVISEQQRTEGGPEVDIELYEVEDSPSSRDAAAYVRHRLVAANLFTATNVIAESGAVFAVPFRERTVWLKPAERTSAILGLLPLVLLLMTVTGGVYPAIDLTAGERERDTLETLMAMPVAKVRLLMAKYLAVLTVTLLTGAMNILAMSVTVYALRVEGILFGETGLTLSLILRLLSMLFLFSLFYAALLLLVTSSARSFKEAQALLIPLMLVTIAPGLLIMLPGWRLEGWLIVMPVTNMLLMARELLEGTLSFLPAMIAAASTLLFAAAALSLAARLFGADSVLTGGGSGWRDMFSRSPSPLETADAAVGLTTLAVLFPLYFIATGLLSRLSGDQIPSRLTLSAVFTVTLFAGVPLMVMQWQGIRRRSGAGLACPPIRVWPGVILLGISAWPWVYEMIIGLQSFGLWELDDETRLQAEELLQAWRLVPIALVVLSLGILPGICEELFFRGFLLNGLRRDMNITVAVIISAVCFGLFHVILAGGAAPQRLLPSTMMGLLLGWVTVRSGSVLPAMLLHAIHNSTLLLLTRFHQELSHWVTGDSQRTHLPTEWLVISGFVLLIGLSLVAVTTGFTVGFRSLASREDTGT